MRKINNSFILARRFKSPKKIGKQRKGESILCTLTPMYSLWEGVYFSLV